MSLKIGSGWTKQTKEDEKKEKKTYMSFSLNEEILELYPSLKNLRFNAFFVPQAERKNENSPGWSLVVSKVKEKTTNSIEEEEEIPI